MSELLRKEVYPGVYSLFGPISYLSAVLVELIPFSYSAKQFYWLLFQLASVI